MTLMMKASVLFLLRVRIKYIKTCNNLHKVLWDVFKQRYILFLRSDQRWIQIHCIIHDRALCNNNWKSLHCCRGLNPIRWLEFWNSFCYFTFNISKLIVTYSLWYKPGVSLLEGKSPPNKNPGGCYAHIFTFPIVAWRP